MSGQVPQTAQSLFHKRPQKSGVLFLSSLGPADFYLREWVSKSNEFEKQIQILPPSLLEWHKLP